MSKRMEAKHQDPLGLSELPMIDPPDDGWNGIQAVLVEDRRSRRRQRLLGGLAVAASFVAVVSIVLLRAPDGKVGLDTPDPGVQVAESTESTEALTLPEASDTTVAELVAMSQLLEQRLRHLRDDTAAMPAESVIYVTELEDLVARVDNELSVSPESIELWSQRVNLLLDLEALFQHQFESEYGRMASL